MKYKLHKATYFCDWCGDISRDIGEVETGMGRYRWHVYLCLNPECGHEMEHKPYVEIANSHE
jgi:hypothetical protein